MVMVKPGLPYLDVLRAGEGRASACRPSPIRCRGEYAMIEAAAAAGAGERDALVLETLMAFKRAGATGVLTYHALDAARLLERLAAEAVLERVDRFAAWRWSIALTSAAAASIAARSAGAIPPFVSNAVAAMPSISPSARVVGARAATAADRASWATTQLSLWGGPATAASRWLPRRRRRTHSLRCAPGRPIRRGERRGPGRPAAAWSRRRPGRADRSLRRRGARAKAPDPKERHSRPSPGPMQKHNGRTEDIQSRVRSLAGCAQLRAGTRLAEGCAVLIGTLCRRLPILGSARP